MEGKELRKALIDLGYEVCMLRVSDGLVFTLWNGNNMDFVSQFNVSKDIIYNFKYLGSFEDLKKLMVVLEGYQNEQEKVQLHS